MNFAFACAKLVEIQKICKKFANKIRSYLCIFKKVTNFATAKIRKLIKRV